MEANFMQMQLICGNILSSKYFCQTFSLELALKKCIFCSNDHVVLEQSKIHLLNFKDKGSR